VAEQLSENLKRTRTPQEQKNEKINDGGKAPELEIRMSGYS